MTSEAVYGKLTDILQNLFDDDSIVATHDLTADRVDGWDSFAQLRLIFAVEQAFKVDFAASEIANLKDVGQLADLILAKGPTASA